MISFEDAINDDVAPPRGERGLKYNIESHHFHHECRSPSWGAWIEISFPFSFFPFQKVAPPRGERGLKFNAGDRVRILEDVAPPRGERGLKYHKHGAIQNHGRSLPLVGSVD